MNACLCGFLMQWFVFLLGKLMIVPYQKGWIQLAGNDPSKTFAYLYTSSSSEMVLIDDPWAHPILFIGMFLITHYMACSVSCLLMLIYERSCATYLLNDYETKKRPGIYIRILVSQQLSGCIFTYLICTMIMPIESCLILIIVLMVLALSGYTYIWYWNTKEHRMMSTRFLNSKYSLQARFQAKENARSLSFTKFVFTYGTILIFLEATLLILRIPERLGDLGIVLLYIIDILNSANPIIVVPLLLVKVPCWKKKFIGDCHWFISKTSPEVTFLKSRSNSQLETEEYFKHLRDSWT